MKFLLIMFIPLLIPFVAKIFFEHTICWKEMGIHVGIMLFLMTGLYFAGTYAATYDTEIYSGKVVDKKQVRVSCSHSYRCRCRTVTHGSGNNKYTTTECDTCYEHTNDYDWRVFASYDDYVNISRVDRQGVKEPPRWTQAQIGDPMSGEFAFTNYIKAAPDSLFNEEQYCTDVAVPAYPKVYDYYKVDRALNAGSAMNTRQWSDEISLMMRQLGPEARANFIIIFTKTLDTRYAEDVRQKWLGGKKNDVILVIGVNPDNTLTWARVVSWSENKMIFTDLRDRVIEKFGGKTFTPDELLPIVEDSIRKNFRRMKEENYEYLESEIEPPLWTLIMSFILALAASCGLTYYFHRNQTFYK